jgi:antirestriction protein ArdC
MTTANTTRTDIFSRVTDRIIQALERGTRPWLQPWNAEHAAGRISRPLRHNGEAYQGVNILMLWGEAETKGYACPIWMTFQQAKELGGHVRKGERGSPVVYASKFTKTDVAEDGETIDREIPFFKEYTVFNAEQIAELPTKFYETKQVTTTTLERIAHVEQFFTNTQAEIRHGGNQAYYAIHADYVQMPRIECFRDSESYYSTLAHEMTHWTRHPSRLNRDFGRKRWGDAGYAMEELVAELGAAFLCADLNITPDVREDHASYLESWLKVLQQDNRAIFTAASYASKAVEWLRQL